MSHRQTAARPALPERTPRTGRRTARRTVAATIALVLVAGLLTGCQSARAGRRCATDDFGQDSNYVLQCRRGRWVRIMTKADAARAILAINLRGGQAATGEVAHQPGGHIDALDAGLYRVSVRGWARDSDGGPVQVHLWVDGTWATSMAADIDRPDIAPVPGGDSRVGFSGSVAVPAGARRACVYAINLPGSPGSDQLVECRNLRVPSDAPADPLAGSASWLDTVNSYRTASGLDPVRDEPAWSNGIRSHLVYLANTPRSYFTGVYQSAHTENPASPWYTADGDAAGRSSNLGGGSGERNAVEGWMTAPFHGIGVLRRNLGRAAFGQLPSGSAGLDVIRGLDGSTPATSPVLFPGNGAVVRLRDYSGGESPSPLESCPGYSAPTGLPMIALLPSGVSTDGVTADVRLPYGTTISGSDVCVISQQTFRTSDGVYGPAGRSILGGDNAVVLIPRQPLTPGTHAVTLHVPGAADIAWSFAVTG